MRFFSHIVRYDTGFAPNPFHGYCTLATCKPRIRATAESGDWVIGLSSRSEHVVYAMRVAEKLDFEHYWSDARFGCKRPSTATRIQRRGDNIYEPLGNGRFRQLPSVHSKPFFGDENPSTMQRDLSSRYVLVATDFVYFGASGPLVPAELAFVGVGRAHRCKFDSVQKQRLEAWVNRLVFDGDKPREKVGEPATWRKMEPSL